jgi:N-acetylglutamate synthase/N-acetylornithine aminotransferase
MNAAEKAIRNEIERRERELDALRKALAALSGEAKAGTGRKGVRKAKTAAQKRALSLALKAAWRRRKAAAKKTDKKTDKKADKAAAPA